MPATIQKPKHQVRRPKSTAGTKSLKLRDKILGALKGSSREMTVEQIAQAIEIESESATTAEKIRAQLAKIEEDLKAIRGPGIPKVILPELHDAGSGRIDAQKVADFIG